MSVINQKGKNIFPPKKRFTWIDFFQLLFSFKKSNKILFRIQNQNLVKPRSKTCFTYFAKLRSDQQSPEKLFIEGKLKKISALMKYLIPSFRSVSLIEGFFVHFLEMIRVELCKLTLNNLEAWSCILKFNLFQITICFFWS